MGPTWNHGRLAMGCVIGPRYATRDVDILRRSKKPLRESLLAQALSTFHFTFINREHVGEDGMRCRGGTPGHPRRSKCERGADVLPYGRRS